jgi:transposase
LRELRELIAGGARKDLSATAAAELLRRVRPAGDVERVRKQIAAGLITQIRSVDALLKSNAKQLSELVAASGSTLTSTVGVAAITAITAGRLLGRTGRADRFPSSASFANYAGAAPIEVASAETARHRLSRSADRQLNAALHTVAITQIRTPGSRGHAYYTAKIAQGKTAREARRCLKRRLADHIWRTMITDQRRAAANPGRHPGATLQSSAAGSTPTASSSDKSLPGPAMHDSTTPRPAT